MKSASPRVAQRKHTANFLRKFFVFCVCHLAGTPENHLELGGVD